MKEMTDKITVLNKQIRPRTSIERAKSAESLVIKPLVTNAE